MAGTVVFFTWALSATWQVYFVTPPSPYLLLNSSVALHACFGLLRGVSCRLFPPSQHLLPMGMHSSPSGVQSKHCQVSAPMYAQTPQQSTPSLQADPLATQALEEPAACARK